MKRGLAAAALVLCAGALRADDADVPKVAGWLAGTFTSAGAELPGAKGPTRLVAALVPKSRIGLGAPVLYVETADAASPDRPYRQQFVRVEDAGAGRVVLKVFDPKDRISVSGKWRDAEDLALFGERDVVERKPCHVTLTRGDGVYYGSTIGTGCFTGLGGARYATERLVVAADRLQIANAGFDAAGRKLWGGEDLVFRRVAAAAAPIATAPKAPAAVAPPPPPPAATPRGPVSMLAPTPVPETIESPVQPSEVLVRAGRLERKLTLADLKRLPALEGRDGIRARGASLKDVLSAAGVDVSEKTRASLAMTVVLAYGADDDSAAVAADEAFSDRSPIVAWESDGKPLAPGDGPLRLVVPGSPARSIRKLLLLEVRDLGAGGAPLSR